MRTRFGLVVLAMLPLVLPADYQAGLDAYGRGDYDTAMREWIAVAEGPPKVVNPAIFSEAHYAVGMLYWQGEGVARDYHKARQWLLKAARLNHAGAQTKLGFMYTDGLAGPQDLQQAFEWFSRSARQGDVDGQYNLGVFYLNGWGTERDPTQAKLYLAAAAAQGDQAAEVALNRLMEGDPTAIAPAPPNRGDLMAEPAPGEAQPKEAAPLSPGIADETWILARDPQHYTIQVIALSSREKVENLIENEQALSPWAAYRVTSEGRTLHVLIQGDYANVAAARAAGKQFPAKVQQPDQLWIRQFRMIQRTIRR